MAKIAGRDSLPHTTSPRSASIENKYQGCQLLRARREKQDDAEIITRFLLYRAQCVSILGLVPSAEGPLAGNSGSRPGESVPQSREEARIVLDGEEWVTMPPLR